MGPDQPLKALNHSSRHKNLKNKLHDQTQNIWFVQFSKDKDKKINFDFYFSKSTIELD